MNFSSFFPDFPAKKEQGFSISSAISVQNEAVGRRKKARRGYPKSIVILNLFQHLLNTVMLNLFQHLSYRGDPESSSG